MAIAAKRGDYSDAGWLGEETHAHGLECARAALNAMRHPDPDMVYGEPCMYRGVSYMVPIFDIWPQMIDKALEESK